MILTTVLENPSVLNLQQMSDLCMNNVGELVFKVHFVHAPYHRTVDGSTLMHHCPIVNLSLATSDLPFPTSFSFYQQALFYY